MHLRCGYLVRAIAMALLIADACLTAAILMVVQPQLGITTSLRPRTLATRVLVMSCNDTIYRRSPVSTSRWIYIGVSDVKVGSAKINYQSIDYKINDMEPDLKVSHSQHIIFTSACNSI